MNDSNNRSAFPDTDDNGIPDYREPWLYRLALRLVLREIKKHPHTLAARALAAIEEALRGSRK